MLYLYHRTGDHYLQALVMPFGLLSVLWEDTVPSTEVRAWEPSEYHVQPPRWSDEELRAKVLEWADSNGDLVRAGVEQELRRRYG